LRGVGVRLGVAREDRRILVGHVLDADAHTQAVEHALLEVIGRAEIEIVVVRNPEPAILADEVGFGKTIEAGLVLAQKWAEGRRRVLIITPANLRKQWSQELGEKFFLPTMILESKNYNSLAKSGVRQPFEQKALVICSFQFAARHAEELMVIPWELVVIDEAHRLRNVYRPDNRIARTLKTALSNAPKVLLTATPLQNSLMELYGLVSLIDDFAFSDAKSFRAQYARLTGEAQFDELKVRLRPICYRTPSCLHRPRSPLPARWIRLRVCRNDDVIEIEAIPEVGDRLVVEYPLQLLVQALPRVPEGLGPQWRLHRRTTRAAVSTCARSFITIAPCRLRESGYLI
jgi:SNF2-related domain